MGKTCAPPPIPNPNPPPVDVRKMDEQWEKMVIKSIRSRGGGVSLPIRPVGYMDRLVKDRGNSVYRPAFTEISNSMPMKRADYFSLPFVVICVLILLMFL